MQRKLTDSKAKAAKPSTNNSPKKYTDGGGLFLYVTKTGKSWRFSYRFDGKQKTLSLGRYPETTLKQARDKHEEARAIHARGIDPSEHYKALKEARAAIVENTLESIGREWFTRNEKNWVEAGSKRIIRRLERDIFPWLGSKPIADIKPPDILKCLRRIEDRGAVDTAHRAKQDISKIFRYAVAIGKAERDPIPDLRGALPPVRKVHFAALTKPSEVAILMKGIESYKGGLIVRSALKMSALLFQRPGEIRRMEWDEIDFEESAWEIPAKKMKMRLAHFVPLSNQAMEVLEELHPYTGNGRYVFPGVRERQRPMSDNTVRQALRRMGYDNSAMTAHGFRAMARTILEEVLDYRPEVIELQLAHAVRDPNGRAYNRTKHREKRIAMMQHWADYLDELLQSDVKTTNQPRSK